MKTTYFIPIKSINLVHYLSNGIIAPTNYIENRFQDLQDKFLNNILLSTSKFTTESNCSIEIVFDLKEEIPKKITDNFFLFDMPIPISRIKGIYFMDKAQRINTVYNITNGSAFIPENLIFLDEEQPIPIFELENINVTPSIVDWKNYLKKFDQLMGGFSLMKIAKEDFQNYPTHYFSTLGNINLYFNNILKEQGIEIENLFEFAFNDNSKHKVFHDTIYAEVTNEIVASFANKENIKIETRNGLILLDKIPESSQTYLVSILDKYGPGKRKQTDSFISDLVLGNFNVKRKEGISLIYGINKGYSSLRNKYKSEKFDATIKFKLDSQIDYYTIESIYQFIFNNKKESGSYSYLKDWCYKAEVREINNSQFLTYQVLDKTIIFKKKEDFSQELFRVSLEKSEKLFEIISMNLSKLLPKFLQLNTSLFKAQLQDELDDFIKEYTQLIFSETSKNKAVEHEKESKILKAKITALSSQLEDKQNIILDFQKILDQRNISTTKNKENEKNNSKNKRTNKNSIKNLELINENISIEVKVKNLDNTEKNSGYKDLKESNIQPLLNESKELINQRFPESLFTDEQNESN